jgi:hypothetical protein
LYVRVRPDGSQTNEVDEFKQSVRFVKNRTG